MNNKQLLLLLSELRWLLQSGIHLLAALNLLAKQSTLKSSRAIIESYIVAIGQGQPLSVAMQHRTPSIVITFIQCGEASGELDKSLSYLCNWLDAMQGFYKSIRQILFYPALVFSAGILLLLFMLLFIVPQFNTLYQQFNAPLPASTQWLLDVTDAAPAWFTPISLSLLSCFAGIVLLWRYSTAGRYRLEYFLLKTPGLGSSLRYYQHARFCRLLNLLLAAGIPLAEALQLLLFATPSLRLQNAIRQTRQAVLQGQQLHQAIVDTHVFEMYCTDLVKIAEECGKLDTILEQLANYYDAALTSRLSRFKQLLQPSMILLLGLLLGVWVLLLYYPLLQLGYAI